MASPLDGLFGAVFGSISDRVAPVFDHSVKPWVSGLAKEAVKTWAPILIAGLRCGVPVNPNSPIRCGGPAVSTCICCGLPTCLHHALVAQTSAVVCVKCVTSYMQILREQGGDPAGGRAPWVDSPFEQGRHKAGPPPREPEEDDDSTREKHLRTLGLDEDADDDDIRGAYRDLVKQWHPDKASDENKARFHKKFLKIQAAYEYLTRDRVNA